jgi:hypothetical protein
MTAHLIVRSTVPEAENRVPFDRWYEQHLHEAAAAFGGISAWRSWSKTDPSVHYAMYEFHDLGAAEAVLKSEDVMRFTAEFDSIWGTRASRTRELVATKQRVSQQHFRRRAG